MKAIADLESELVYLKDQYARRKIPPEVRREMEEIKAKITFLRECKAAAIQARNKRQKEFIFTGRGWE